MALTEQSLPAFQRRIFLVLVGAYAVTYLVFFFIGLFTFPGKYYLPNYRGQWTAARAFIRFMGAFLAVHCTAVLVSYSFIPTSGTGVSGADRRTTFSRLIMSTIVLFLVLTVIYSVLLEGVDRTAVARSFLERAKQARAEGRFRESRAYLEYYRQLDPGSEVAAGLLQQINERFASDISDEARRSRNAVVQSAGSSELSPGELLEKGRRYFEEEDFYSAYYFAQLAKETAEQRGEEWTAANRLAARANEEIEASGDTRAEREQAMLYSEKQRGLDALATTDPDLHVEAYYIFKRLSREYPDDPEVRRYRAEAEARVEQVSFFVESAEDIQPIPGERDILFVNAPEGAEYSELVYFGKVVWKEAQTFVEDIEIFAVDAAGAPVYHLEYIGTSRSRVHRRYTSTVKNRMGCRMLSTS